MLTKKAKNGTLTKEVLLPDKFRPNLLMMMNRGAPPKIVLVDPVTVVAVVSSIGLSWNTTSNKRFDSNYRLLLDHLAEKLPLERKFEGGVFYAQIHAGKQALWEADSSKGMAAAIYTSSGKRGGLCVKNLKITIGEYAGDDLRSAIRNALRTGKREIFKTKNLR